MRTSLSALHLRLRRSIVLLRLLPLPETPPEKARMLWWHGIYDPSCIQTFTRYLFSENRPPVLVLGFCRA